MNRQGLLDTKRRQKLSKNNVRLCSYCKKEESRAYFEGRKACYNCFQNLHWRKKADAMVNKQRIRRERQRHGN